MNEMKRIADLLERVGDGDAWHGPSVDATVGGLTAAQAAARPLAAGHSIWELALHIAVWDRVVARRLSGERIEPSSAEDWAPVRETTDAAWRRVVADLRTAREELHTAMLSFDERRIDESVPGKTYSFYVMAHGVVQHDLYHAGQIALLKKARE
jgi:uncharacterized damage-inducible protein DinB